MKYDFSDLQGKNVLLVGGFGLIGKELSYGFSSLGADLIIADRVVDEAFLKKLSKINNSKNISFLFDISKKKEINDMIRFSYSKFKKIDVLVNCSFPRTTDWSLGIENVPFESVQKNLLDHLGGYYYISQQVALKMSKNKKGSIINFSSIYGLVAPTFSIYENTNMTTAPAYALIKGGINTMTKYFASYFGNKNIRVNCISPGGVFDNQDPKFVKRYKELTPLARMAVPKDLVLPVLFLASDASRYITGHNLLVDGGWTVH
jgi:NAD(P)-dependent dehydrogenase (short-subunit alcohol dehydrogenase family)